MCVRVCGGLFLRINNNTQEFKHCIESWPVQVKAFYIHSKYQNEVKMSLRGVIVCARDPATLTHTVYTEGCVNQVKKLLTR